VGNGHVSAANALEAEAASRSVRVSNVDMLEMTPKPFRAWYAGGYEMLVRRNPGFWRHLYRSSDRPLLAFQFQTLLDRIFCRGVAPLLADFRPDWVLCTHSLPQPALAALRARYGFRMAVCVTDLHPHLMWLRGAPDRYFVPTDQTARLLAARQPSARWRIVVSGMPVHFAFEPAAVPPSDPVVLVSSGGIGGGPVKAVVQQLAKVGCRVIVAAGRNARLRKELQDAGLPPSVEILGHIPLQEMAVRMRQASLLVGKPGGLTTFEALASGLPLVIYEPFVIPGQEEDNARFVIDAGIALSAADLDSLSKTVREVLQGRDRLSAMRRAALSNAQPGATRRIVDSLAGDGKQANGRETIASLAR
jgi:processive 1,2-diacylglycerol beta-glucosyltransferase